MWDLNTQFFDVKLNLDLDCSWYNTDWRVLYWQKANLQNICGHAQISRVSIERNNDEEKNVYSLKSILI